MTLFYIYDVIYLLLINILNYPLKLYVKIISIGMFIHIFLNLSLIFKSKTHFKSKVIKILNGRSKIGFDFI